MKNKIKFIFEVSFLLIVIFVCLFMSSHFYIKETQAQQPQQCVEMPEWNDIFETSDEFGFDCGKKESKTVPVSIPGFTLGDKNNTICYLSKVDFNDNDSGKNTYCTVWFDSVWYAKCDSQGDDSRARCGVRCLNF